MTTAIARLADAPIAAPPARGRRRRIVILTEDSKPALGGIAEYLHQLALATATHHDVLIVTSVPGATALNPGLPFQYKEAGWFRAQERHPGDALAPIRRLNTLIWHLGRRERVRSLLAHIHAQQPDSSYVLGRMSPVTFPWCVACQDLGIPYTAIGYGLELIEPLSGRLARRRAAVASEAQHWFAISCDTRDKLRQAGVPFGRQSLLLPGVAVPDRLEVSSGDVRAVRARLGIGPHRFVFSLSYLRRRKGIDLAIDALAAVADEFPDLRYVVGGHGPEQAALFARARALGVGDRVVFVGAIDDATKAVLFAECEFFALPTRAEAHDVEGFGIVFLEAGLYGKAVIGGNNGGVPEAVVDGTTGLLVDTCDAVELTAAYRQLLRDPVASASMGRRGRERARAEFDWTDRGRSFGATLDAMAERPPMRVQRHSAPLTRLRRGAGQASNRVVSGASILSGITRRGRLAAYLVSRTAPLDQEACARETLAWLRRAFIAGGYGGAAANYHVVHGWAGAYPEITGYLIPTLLHFGTIRREPDLREIAQAAGSWLARTRLADGAICRKQWFPGNTAPSVFNTAQVVEGWCALAQANVAALSADGDWLTLARGSGDWLVRQQERDGSWVKNAFNGISHSYYARVAAPLARLAVATGDSRYHDSARRAFDWVLSQQRPTGWFLGAGFTATEAPTTHTIGYVIEGLLQGAKLLDEPRYADAAEHAARKLLESFEQLGWLPGRFAPDWRPRGRWRCLTGDAQVGISWCLIHRRTGETRYGRAAGAIADGIRRTVRVTGAWPEISGGIQGSSPPWGDYDPYGYPTHAAKFALDLFALLMA